MQGRWRDSWQTQLLASVRPSGDSEEVWAPALVLAQVTEGQGPWQTSSWFPAQAGAQVTGQCAGTHKVGPALPGPQAAPESAVAPRAEPAPLADLT